MVFVVVVSLSFPFNESKHPCQDYSNGNNRFSFSLTIQSGHDHGGVSDIGTVQRSVCPIPGPKHAPGAAKCHWSEVDSFSSGLDQAFMDFEKQPNSWRICLEMMSMTQGVVLFADFLAQTQIST